MVRSSLIYKKLYNKVISSIEKFPKFVCNKQIENKNTNTVYHHYDFEFITIKNVLQIRRIYLPFDIYKNKSPMFIAVSTRLPSCIFKNKNVLKRILCSHCVKVAKKIPKLQTFDRLYYDVFQLNKKSFKQHIFKNCKNTLNEEPTFLSENVKV